MAWLKVMLGFLFAVIVFCLLTLYWFLPFNSIEYTSAPINSNFSLNSSTLSQMQFYPNMRYPSPNISFNIDSTLCNLNRQDDIKQAMGIIQNLTILKFYSVSSNPEISISCNSKVIVNENYFVAGEGGPTSILETKDFNVITYGQVLLLRDSNCANPNIATHELLHALGFNHSTNPNNVMYPITNCDQTIGQDIPALINSLYSTPSYSDLSFANASAIIHGRYLDTNFSISNNGLNDSNKAILIISADGNQIDSETISPIQIGEGVTLMLKNLWVPSLNVNELEYQINTNFSEINKNDNQIRLEIKK
jgi:Astacin (Peptidase family M12A)